ncbi:helix-turn-helix domain-containing protein [Staphylococcus simulans]|uniref:helix-turn-helix domain-containing protein n=1 Tax=Staphylococcus simulans TaxID=1286 RepID=UPI00399A912F
MLEYRLKHQLSYKETAEKFNIISSSVIAQWQKKFNEYGILGLKSKPKKVLRLTRENNLLCTKFSHKSRSYNSYKVILEKPLKIY